MNEQQTPEQLAEHLIAELTSHCEQQHMTIGNRRCCREIARVALQRAEARALREVSAGVSPGWIKAEGHPPPPVGDCRKIVWLRDVGGMEWWGVRAYYHGEGYWMVGNREESATVLFWMDGPAAPAADAQEPQRKDGV